MDRRVDGGAFVIAAQRRVLGVDFGIMDFPPEQRRHVAGAARLRLHLFHIVFDAGEALEIGVDVVGGLATRYAAN